MKWPEKIPISKLGSIIALVVGAIVTLLLLEYLPISTRDAVIGGIVCAIVTVFLEYYLETKQGTVQKEEVTGIKGKEVRVKGVSIGDIKGGTVNINVYPNVSEEEFSKRLGVEKESAHEKDKALFDAGRNFEQGNKHFSSREYDEAIQKFREALKDLSEGSELQADVYYNLGNTYSKKYAWSEAESAYKKSIKILEKKK